MAFLLIFLTQCLAFLRKKKSFIELKKKLLEILCKKKKKHTFSCLKQNTALRFSFATKSCSIYLIN